MIRRAIVAGAFYEGERGRLEKQLKECFEGITREQNENVLGAVVPHAGYLYSGRVSGAVYSRITIPETFIIIGPNHYGLGKKFAVMKEGIWRTPIGDVKIDSILAKEILSNSKFLEEDCTAHSREHSIELQLPFLQYLSKDFQFVPIVTIGHETRICEDIGNSIAKSIQKINKEVMIIASSDLTLYEPEDIANRKDKEILSAIFELNGKELIRKAKELNLAPLGGQYGHSFIPAAIMLIACKALGAKEVELVRYMTSGDVIKDYTTVVSYAGILVK